MRITFCFVVLFAICCQSCKQEGGASKYRVISGKTMGTYYRVTSEYTDSTATSVLVKTIVEGTLKEINQAVSTYIEDSEISKINRAKAGVDIALNDQHLVFNLEKAIEWYNRSNGYMDISIMPLVNYWGFGYEEKRAVANVDSTAVSEILNNIGMDKWQISAGHITKMSDDQELDMSALAKGYAVDYVAHILNTLGSEHYLVDIGGEAVSKGVNEKGEVWTLGINTPSSDASIQDVELVVRLDNKAMASSGNYRNYHEVDKQIYGHTIDPNTGYPYQDSLLAVSVITDECIDADAIATACMAMGYAKAATFIAEHPEVSACFLVGSSDGTIKTNFANGFIRYVVE